jgi:murein DD-endopeptidase MepM/ murein hydrolase activator NlpD
VKACPFQRHLILLPPVILLFCSPFWKSSFGNDFPNPKSEYQPAQDPDLTGVDFFSPVHDPDRKDFKRLRNRTIGAYGDFRSSYQPGHLHAGIDLAGDFEERVFSIGWGQVVHIFRQFPHKTIVIEHHLPDETSVYSVYTHVEEIHVEKGDWVDCDTPLARLFDREELEKADFGTLNHLHLEIRTSYEDEGRASYSSMTREELDRFCTDPLIFFEKHLNRNPWHQLF